MIIITNALLCWHNRNMKKKMQEIPEKESKSNTNNENRKKEKNYPKTILWIGCNERNGKEKKGKI